MRYRETFWQPWHDIYIHLSTYLFIYLFINSFFTSPRRRSQSSDAEHQKQTSQIKKKNESSLSVNYQPVCAKGDKVHPIKSRESDHDMAGWKVNTADYKKHRAHLWGIAGSV